MEGLTKINEQDMQWFDIQSSPHSRWKLSLRVCKLLEGSLAPIGTRSESLETLPLRKGQIQELENGWPSLFASQTKCPRASVASMGGCKSHSVTDADVGHCNLLSDLRSQKSETELGCGMCHSITGESLQYRVVESGAHSLLECGANLSLQVPSTVASLSSSGDVPAWHALREESHRAQLHDVWRIDSFKPVLGKYGNAGSNQSLTSLTTIGSRDEAPFDEFKMMQSDKSGVQRAMTPASRAGDALTSESCFQRLVMRPNSKNRTAWDFVTALAIMFDVFIIPLQVFDLSAPRLDLLSNRLLTIFWTCDLAGCFLVGNHYNGFVEMRPKRIAWRYLRSWFFADLLIVSIEWLLMMWPFTPVKLVGMLRVAKVMRMVRLTRALRLLRVVKVLLKLTSLPDLLLVSDVMSLSFEVVKLICFVVMAAHFIACGWFAIGKMRTRIAGDASWVSHLKANFEDDDQGELPFLYVYTTAMHWALTQFTPASMEVVPRNWVERTYAICVLLLGLITFSSMISSITTSTSRLRNMKAEETRKLDDVRKCITQNRTSLELSCCIFSYLRQYRREQRNRLYLPDVEFLNILPECLQNELRVEAFAPTVMTHLLFKAACNVDEQSVTLICQSSISERFLVRDERLFSSGDQGQYMWFIRFGTLRYDLGPRNQRIFKNMRQGAFVSEISLWIAWTYQGRAMAKKNSEVLSLDAHKFHDTVRYTGISPQLQEYALIFLGHVSHATDTFFEVEYDTQECIDAVRIVFESMRAQTESQGLQNTPLYRQVRRFFTQGRSFVDRWLTGETSWGTERSSCSSHAPGSSCSKV